MLHIHICIRSSLYATHSWELFCMLFIRGNRHRVLFVHMIHHCIRVCYLFTGAAVVCYLFTGTTIEPPSCAHHHCIIGALVPPAPPSHVVESAKKRQKVLKTDASTGRPVPAAVPMPGGAPAAAPPPPGIRSGAAPAAAPPPGIGSGVPMPGAPPPPGIGMPGAAAAPPPLPPKNLMGLLNGAAGVPFLCLMHRLLQSQCFHFSGVFYLCSVQKYLFDIARLVMGFLAGPYVAYVAHTQHRYPLIHILALLISPFDRFLF